MHKVVEELHCLEKGNNIKNIYWQYLNSSYPYQAKCNWDCSTNTIANKWLNIWLTLPRCFLQNLWNSYIHPERKEAVYITDDIVFFPIQLYMLPLHIYVSSIWFYLFSNWRYWCPTLFSPNIYVLFPIFTIGPNLEDP